MTQSNMPWPERRDRYVKEIFQFFGWGFWWDKNGKDVLQKVATFDSKVQDVITSVKSKFSSKEDSQEAKQDAR